MAESLSETNEWIRVYPEVGVLSCPYCQKSYWKAKQREKHVRRYHGPRQERWKCVTCSRAFSTKQGAGIHYASAHSKANDGPSVGGPTVREEDGE